VDLPYTPVVLIAAGWIESNKCQGSHCIFGISASVATLPGWFIGADRV